MKRTVGCAALCVLAGALLASDDVVELVDGLGDVLIRRTDTGADGALGVGAVMPDLLRVTISGWEADDPLNDPYTGRVGDPKSSDLFRLDVVLAGHVNPVGTVGLGGLAYDPFRFGPSPVIGFVELDMDDDEDTGGQLEGAAELRFLANVARFGGLPESSDAERAALSGAGPGGCGDWDLNFWTEPFYERSGEDFSLVLCGCHEVTVVSKSGGDQDDLFEPGETWIVRSRYFQRAAGYQDASSVFGGSDFGLYDPEVNLRFVSDPVSDTTTITLVEALTMAGAAQLTGEPEQPIDSEIGPFSHHSVEEAIQDLIDNANGLSGEVRVLTERWDDKDREDALDVSDWRVNALFGTVYASPKDGLYAWTDVGFKVRRCDVNGDEFVDGLDPTAFDSFLASNDGSSCDADGQVNGVFTVAGPGPNFTLFDLNGDGVVDGADRLVFCRGDLTGSSSPGDPSYGVPDGDVDGDDYFFYLDQFSSGNLARADLTGSSDPLDSDYGLPNLIIDSEDFFFYLDLFVQGCP